MQTTGANLRLWATTYQSDLGWLFRRTTPKFEPWSKECPLDIHIIRKGETLILYRQYTVTKKPFGKNSGPIGEWYVGSLKETPQSMALPFENTGEAWSMAVIRGSARLDKGSVAPNPYRPGYTGGAKQFHIPPKRRIAIKIDYAIPPTGQDASRSFAAIRALLKEPDK